MTAALSGPPESATLAAEYVNGQNGKLFVTRFLPGRAAESKRAVVCLPPFGEEMNKSRRMLALQGRQLASCGTMFVLPDVAGTGDSEGDFGDVSWAGWRNDIGIVIEWLRESGVEQIDFLAVRSGIFLGSDYVSRASCRVALWSPVAKGSAVLDQLFRTLVARSMGSDKRRSVANIRDDVARAGSIEVAGYLVSHDLMQASDQLDLADIQYAAGSNLLWADVSPAQIDGIPRKAQRFLSSWDTQRSTVGYVRIIGSQFWMGPEIEVVPELLDETTRFFVE